MHKGGGFLLAILVSVLPLTVTAIDLSDVVIPSEDELRQALDLGEISYDDYVILCDITRLGLDSTNLYLLDAIPNLGYFLGTRPEETSAVEHDQQAGAQSTSRGRPAGKKVAEISHRYYQEAHSQQRGWYRTRIRSSVNEKTQVRFTLDREKSGCERVTGRTLTFADKSNWLRRLELGTFTTRFGLGSVIGYHGKLFDFSDCINSESWWYPDQGGFNGALVEIRKGPVDVKGLLSRQQDSTAGLTIAAGSIGFGSKRVSGGIVGSFSRLEERSSVQAKPRQLDLLAIGTTGELSYRGGKVATEVSVQSGGKSEAVSAVVEGRHKADGVTIRYAAWAYGDNLVDITAGSKAGSLSKTIDAPAVAFRYRAKRPGQEGAIIKTRTPLSANLALNLAALYAGYNRTHRNIEYSASLERHFGRRAALELACLAKSRQRPTTRPNTTETCRFRLEGRFDSDKLVTRTYIAYDTETDVPAEWSCLANCRYVLPRGAAFEVWARIADIGGGSAGHWYVYVRGQQQIMKTFSGALKVSHLFNNRSAVRHQTTIIMEATVSI